MQISKRISTVFICFLLAACGGGGGDNDGGGTPVPDAAAGGAGNPPASGTGDDAGADPTPGDSSGGSDGVPPSSGTDGGTDTDVNPPPTYTYDDTARLNRPTSITADATGNLFVLDSENKSIRKIAANGDVSTVASGLIVPTGLEIDAAGYLYTIDNGEVQKIAPDGTATTLARVIANTQGWMTIDESGSLYLLGTTGDTATPAILKVDQEGNVTTLYSGEPINDQTRGIARDAAGNLYVSRDGKILMISVAGAVSDFGSGLDLVQDMEVDASGNIHVTDFMISAVVGSGTCRSPISSIRLLRLSADGTNTTVLSGAPDAASSCPGTEFGIPFLAAGGDGNGYVTYAANHTVYKVTPAGVATLLAGRPAEAGNAD